VTPTETPTVPVTRGDANCDGLVSAADTSYLLAILDGTLPPLCVGADADGNAVLDDNDLAAAIEAIFDDNAVP
jgi:hypothetical protein